MTSRGISLLFVMLLTAAPATAFEDIGLRPHWPDPALDGQSLEMTARLAAVDSLHAILIEDPSRTDVRLELVRLYRGSELMKHRVLAIELAQSLPDSLRSRELALTYARTFNPWDEEEQLLELVRSRPDEAESHRLIAFYYLREGLFELDPNLLAEARAAFERATACVDADTEDWLGLAATLCAADDQRSLRPVAEKLVELAPDNPGSWLYLGLAREAYGQSHGAAQAYREGLRRLGPHTRARFTNLGWKQIAIADLPQSVSMTEPPPMPELRGWWARLIEAEVIFGDPDHGVHAWNDTAGAVYLMFGRPKFMKALKYATPAEIAAVPRASRHADEIARQISGIKIEDYHRFWVWIVDVDDGHEEPFVFQRLTRFAPWQPTPTAGEELEATIREGGPVRLAASIPEVRTTGEVSVAMVCTGFPARDEQVRIEAWVSATDRRIGDQRAPLYAELVLRDAFDRELDRVRHELDASRSRSRMATSLPRFPQGAQGWVTGFGALVPLGRYSVSVEVRDEDGELHAVMDRALNSDVESPPFGISELLLCDAYAEGRVPSWLPPEYVRHARLVIPHPEATVHRGQEEIFVYYEVYGAAVDETGLTRLEVQYEVYDEASFDPIVGGPAYVEGQIARPLSDARFPNQRTGRAAGGIVVKGTRIDLTDFAPGRYVILVRVSDQIARREAQRMIRLEVGS